MLIACPALNPTFCAERVPQAARWVVIVNYLIPGLSLQAAPPQPRAQRLWGKTWGRS